MLVPPFTPDSSSMIWETVTLSKYFNLQVSKLLKPSFFKPLMGTLQNL
jgi:hypothetical protein